MSNDFLINTKNETALVYNDVSVNENMHLATAFKILRRPGNDLMEHLSPEQYRFFRRTVIQIVLATDMAGHSELLQAPPLLLLSPLPVSDILPKQAAYLLTVYLQCTTSVQHRNAVYIAYTLGCVGCITANASTMRYPDDYPDILLF